MPQQSALTGDEVEVWRAFYSMRRHLDRALDRQLQDDSSISSSEYEILITLHNAPEHQLRLKELAGVVGWEKSRVSHQVTRMEKRGLVGRVECDTDGRGSSVVLTADGRRATLGATRGHVDAIRRYFFDVLGDDDGQRLLSLSARVLGAIGSDPDCETDSEADSGSGSDDAETS
jgi:DNA-binding MarR family transcriptional regulator